jgi:hypothetical protein
MCLAAPLQAPRPVAGPAALPAELFRPSLPSICAQKTVNLTQNRAQRGFLALYRVANAASLALTPWDAAVIAARNFTIFSL